MAPLLFALAQAASTTAASAAPPPRFSILYQPCAAPASSKDVVVCAKDGAGSERLPLPADAPPTPGYVKPDSRDYRDNAGGAAPCATRIGSCPVLTEAPLAYRAIGAAAKAVGDARRDHRWAKARAADGARRQAIDLDAPAPTGKLEP